VLDEVRDKISLMDGQQYMKEKKNKNSNEPNLIKITEPPSTYCSGSQAMNLEKLSPENLKTMKIGAEAFQRRFQSKDVSRKQNGFREVNTNHRACQACASGNVKEQSPNLVYYDKRGQGYKARLEQSDRCVASLEPFDLEDTHLITNGIESQFSDYSNTNWIGRQIANHERPVSLDGGLSDESSSENEVILVCLADEPLSSDNERKNAAFNMRLPYYDIIESERDRSDSGLPISPCDREFVTKRMKKLYEISN